ncbi:hypothetical protein RQP46_005164 [Phenoliferia psychrophenolica]
MADANLDALRSEQAESAPEDDALLRSRSSVSLLTERFTRDELVEILTSTLALGAHFTEAAQPLIKRQDAEYARLDEEARLEAARKESQARLNRPGSVVRELLDQLLAHDGEPMPAHELEQTQKKVEDGIRALIAHVVDPLHGLVADRVLSRLAKLHRAMAGTRPHAGRPPVVPIAWDYVGALTRAVISQRDRLEPLERPRIASELEFEYPTLDWESIWHGYLHETSYTMHQESIKKDPLNALPQFLRIPAHCKVPTERSSSLLQSLPFEILSQIILFAANDFIPHPKTTPTRITTLDGLRADLLRTLALSVDFPTFPIEIPTTIRTLSLLHINLPTTDGLVNNLRHLTPSPLDTLILLDCSTPDTWNSFNAHPNDILIPPEKSILNTVTTLHLDASQTAAVFLSSEHLPAVTTLEFSTVAHGVYDYIAPVPTSNIYSHQQRRSRASDYRRVALDRQPTADEHWATRVLCATVALAKLERLLIPDEKEWRAAWKAAEENWDNSEDREQLARRPKPVEVVWKQ